MPLVTVYFWLSNSPCDGGEDFLKTNLEPISLMIFSVA